MKFKRNAAINLLLSQFSEDMEMERENAHAYYNSLSDEELYIEAEAYRVNDTLILDHSDTEKVYH